MRVEQTEERFGWVYYDAECPRCVRLARRVEGLLRRRGLVLVPLQTPGAAAQLGIAEERLLLEMRLRSREGKVFGGADAVVEILRRLHWAWPLVQLAGLPGILPVLRWIYARVAAHRYCLSGSCGWAAGLRAVSVRGRSDVARERARPALSLAGWLPLLVFPGSCQLMVLRWLARRPPCSARLGKPKNAPTVQEPSRRPRRKRVFFELP